jgi:tetratricopeptide (TPR) repeat protein
VNDDAVVSVLGSAIGDLRKRMGEPAASVGKFDAPVEQATSPSLAALQAFSMGELKRARGEQVEGVPFYLSALDLDPNFALAYGRLGTIYRNVGELDRSAQFQLKAFDLRDRVSEPERLYITAHYYQDVTGEVDKAIATYQVWARTYPSDWSPHNNLAVIYLELGQAGNAAGEGREAVALNPTNVLAYNNLASAYLRLNNFHEAKSTYQQALGQGLDSSSIHRGLYAIAFVEDDQTGMRREVNWASNKEQGFRMLSDQAAVAASEGRLRLSGELARRSVEGALRDGFTGSASWVAARQALTEAAFAKRTETRSRVNKALGIDRSQDALTGGSLALALVGDSRSARRLAQELDTRFQRDSWVKHALLPTVQAAISLAEKDPERSIEALDEVKPYEFGLRSGFLPTYIRGLALLRQRRTEEAAAQFQSILDHRGVDATSPIYPLARLELARCYAAAHSVSPAREAYHEFLDQWKNADQKLAILRTARVEAASLQ